MTTPRRSPSGTAPPASPSSPPTPHTYESFSDLVSPISTPKTHRRGLFGSTSSAGTPRRWRTGGSESDGLISSPGRRGRYGSLNGNEEEEEEVGEEEGEDRETEETREGWELSTLGLVCLTVGLAGAQLAWTVEMA
ncbi:hypothetical protein P7C70_g9421, partial [Phenoliferia sp. Uapishka_3]